MLRRARERGAPGPALRTALARGLVLLTLAGACLFGAAGTLWWWNGWVFMATYLVLVAVLTGAACWRSPELVEERTTAARKARTWDRALVPVLALVLPLSVLALAGLDRRFGWTHSITPLASALALPFMLAGCALTFAAMRTNPFFSSHVRIQDDRGQRVISSGPYRHLRHPGYTGAILYNLGLPVLLGSLAAIWPGVVFLALSVARTELEDRTLRRELVGYEAYASRVRFRLVPFIW